MIVLFLPVPHFRQYNPSSFSSSPIALRALEIPTCASNLCGEGSALCRPWHIPEQLCWLTSTAERGCFTVQAVGPSATTLKEKDVM